MGLLELLRLALVVARRRSCSTSPSGSRSSGPRRSRRSPCSGTPRRAWTRATSSRRAEPRPGRATRREAIAPLADAGVVGQAPRADERRHPAVLAGPGRGTAPTCTSRWPRRSRRSRTCAASCWPPTATGTRAAAGPGRGPAADQGRAGLRRAGRAARRGCPTSSCSASTPRRSAWPASRSGSRSRSTARCRASIVTTVTLRTSDGDEVTKEVRDRRRWAAPSDWVVWKPKATGDFTLTLDGPASTPTRCSPTTTG